MNTEMRRKVIVACVAAVGVVVGVIGGFFAAHLLMGDMPGMTTGKGGVPRENSLSGQAGGGRVKTSGEKGDMKGMPTAPPGAIAIPAGTRQLIGVRSAPVDYAALQQEIRAVGIVDYDERRLTQVNLRVSGWIQDVFVDSVGRPVRKGEPLFTLYSPDLLATQDEYLLALKGQAKVSGSPLPEVKEGAAALVSSAKERLKLWNLTDEQIAALERRGKADPVLTIYAPSSGIVLKREALPGKYVEPNTTLYEVGDLSTVWIYADIYEYEIASVKLNQRATVSFEAYPGETLQGKVIYIYPYLNEPTRTVRVRLEFPNPGLKLKPGMYGKVNIHVDTQKRLAVPKEAVLDTGLRQLVFLDRGEGIYMPTPVKLGRQGQDLVEVLEGVKEGDRVVTSANFLLDAESKLASAGSMQAMMGQIGMADWQMRGAYEKKMDMGEGGVPRGKEPVSAGSGRAGEIAPPGREGEKGMQGMEGMKEMPGMAPGKPVSETRQVSEHTLTFSTAPEKPKAGDTLLRLKLADPAGYAVTNAQVVFTYTMPMPGMTESKAKAAHTKDGVYEAKAMLGMGGMWIVMANVTLPGLPPISEKFQFVVAGGGM
jgi:Cu(I)/Ag(I) efflux system membrane fusion protein